MCLFIHYRSFRLCLITVFFFFPNFLFSRTIFCFPDKKDCLVTLNSVSFSFIKSNYYLSNGWDTQNNPWSLYDENDLLGLYKCSFGKDDDLHPHCLNSKSNTKEWLTLMNWKLSPRPSQVIYISSSLLLKLLILELS